MGPSKYKEAGCPCCLILFSKSVVIPTYSPVFFSRMYTHQLSTRPPHNELKMGRTSLAKGACPGRIEGGQAHRGSRLQREDFLHYVQDKLI
jgi:hypothetical protein